MNMITDTTNDIIKNTNVAVSAFKRKRSWFAFLGVVIMMALWLVTDPDVGIMAGLPFGAKIIDIFTVASKGIIYILLLHYARKFVFDYVSMQRVFRKSIESAEGAGMAAIACAIFTLAFAIAILAAVMAG